LDIGAKTGAGTIGVKKELYEPGNLEDAGRKP
jgi:hypothetical protein